MDSHLRKQVQDIFLKLTNTVFLIVDNSRHPKQSELEILLGDVASTSSFIELKPSNNLSESPRFTIGTKAGQTGISFTGIPTGHEFSSLILAILNANGKGQFPDEFTQKRIKNLKGPVSLKTYISLTCENCPDVVQTLNQLALIHGNFTHEMIDGSFDQHTINTLGIQGVPSVLSGTTLISSGRISLGELLDKLESAFGTSPSSEEPATLEDADVTIVGGGPAGISAAIYTARKGLKTVVIADRIGGQLNETKGIENFISVPYTEGKTLSENLKSHLKSYNIQVYENRKVESVDTGDDFHTLSLQTKETLKTRSMIVATGAQWRKLNIPGEKDYIGRGVAFCPHCDGPFYKGKDVAVIGGGNSGIEAAIDLAGIVNHVTVFEFSTQLKADDVLQKKLNSLNNVTVILNAASKEIIGDGQKVTHLNYEDRKTGTKKTVALDGIFVQIGLVPNSQFIQNTVDCTPFGEIIVDAKGQTSVNGIFAAGDVTTVPFKQIVIAVGEGAKAGLGAFEQTLKPIISQ